MIIKEKIKFNSKEEWLQLRRNYIGASEVAILTGHNPYRTPLDLYLDKVEGFEQPISERMQWGNILEDAIAREWANRNQTKVTKSNFLYIYRGVLAATIDRFAKVDNETVIVEIKNMSDYAFRSYPQINGIPEIYYIQIQAQLLCTGVNKAYFVALINNGELYEATTSTDMEVQDMIIINAKSFYENHIIKKVPPKISSKEIKHSDLEESYVDGNEEDYKIFEEYKILSGAISDLEKKRKDLQEKMKERLGTNKAVIYNGNKLFWWDKSVLFNSKEFQKDNPELYEKYKTNVILKLSTAR